jgi:hypothetical protein
VLIQNAGAPFQRNNLPPPSYTQRFSKSMMTNFVHWGGFARKKSLRGPLRIDRSTLLFGGGSIDHPHMRATLELWASTLGINNPYDSRTPSRPAKKGPVRIPPPRLEVPVPVQVEPPQLQVLHDILDSTTNSKPQTADETRAEEQLRSSGEETPQSQQDPPTAEPAMRTPEPEPTPARPDAPPAEAKQPPTEARPKPKHTPAPRQVPLPVDRARIRAARGASRKAEPLKTAPTTTVQKESVQENPVVKTSAKGKKRKEGRSQTEPAKEVPPQRPVEVEERKSVITSRLKGMFGGWV